MDVEKPDFVNALVRELVKSDRNSFEDNYDVMAKPRIQMDLGMVDDVSAAKQQVKAYVRAQARIHLSPFIALARAYWRRLVNGFKRAVLPSRFFRYYALRYSDFGFLYSKLQDTESRKLLTKLAAFRVLGHKKVKLPRNSPEFWAALKDIEKLPTIGQPFKIKFMDASLRCFDLQPMGLPIKSYMSGTGAACTFVQKQYEFHRNGIHCKAEPGDIAIDGGGCWGETALYFANEVGPEGKVFTFEFIPSNLEVLRANVGNNPELAKRIEIMEHPLWSTSENKLYYVDWGPGSNVFSDKTKHAIDGECTTLSIDDLVQLKNLPSVDFIKMDIEGAELDALKGAEQTIRKFRPKMAISLYHQLSDFTTIPKYLDSLDLEYDFYLDHHTIYQNETVLFARPKAMN